MQAQRLWLMLTEVAGRMGVEVRLERLDEWEDFEVNGGLCRLGDRVVAIVDRRLEPGGRADQLGRALAGLGINGVSMLPVVRQFIEQFSDAPADEE